MGRKDDFEIIAVGDHSTDKRKNTENDSYIIIDYF